MTLALQDINIGTTANDGTGDKPRAAGQKINANNAAIAAALDLLQPLNANLTAIANLTTQSYGRSLLEAANQAGARAALGVYATADVDAALALKASLASPTFTGIPTAPTQSAGNNTTRLATTEFVSTAIANLINSAPGTLDTLGEIAAALAEDDDVVAALTTTVSGKLTASNNLSDVPVPATARSNLGLGSFATISSLGFASLTSIPTTLAGYGIIDAAGLALNTFTRKQTITQGAANESALASTGYSLTGNNAQALLDFAGTWNTTGTPAALKMNITDTASNAASLLLDLQTGGVSQLRVTKYGALVLPAGNDVIPSGTNVALLNGNGQFIFTRNGSRIAGIGGYSADGILAINSAFIGFASGSNISGGNFAPDTSFLRDAAGIMALRGASLTAPGALSLYTYGASPPTAPAASIVRLYADTSGGKIRLMAVFPSGAAQQIAIEP